MQVIGTYARVEKSLSKLILGTILWILKKTREWSW